MPRSTLALMFTLILCVSFVGCPPPSTNVTVPNVGGMTQNAATAAIEAAQLTVGNVTTQPHATVAAGHVISQNPPSGASVASNSAVNLVISTGPASVNVPNVGGMAQDAAEDAIEAAQLTVGTVTTQDSPSVAAGHVISQNPPAGASVSQNSSVALVVSTGWTPSVAWSYTPNYAPNNIIGTFIDKTSDGGFVVAGGHTGYNMYALKLSAAGTYEWDQTYSNIEPGPNQTELWRHIATGIRQTDDGEYVLLGAGNNLNDGLPSPAFLLVRTNSLGVVQGSSTYAPENPYSLGNLCVNNYAQALQITDDGGFVAVGNSYVGQYGLASMLKTDADGQAEFVKVVDKNDADQNNHPDYEQQIMDGQQTADGGYILSGYCENGNPAGYVALLIKVDEAGNQEWSKQYNYPLLDYGAEAYAVHQTADGGYLLCGLLWNSILNNKAINHGCWIARVDENGDEVWSRYYGNVTTVRDPNDILETPQGDFVATGSLNTHLVLSKFTAAGDVLWNFEVPGVSVSGRAMVLTADGGCAILASGGSGGAVVVKINHVFVPEP